MASLRAQAVAAHTAAQSGRTSEARAALAAVLAPFDPASLTVEHVEATATWTLIVFTDGDIHLGVRSLGDGWDVHIVAPAGSGVDGWTDLVEVTSLAQLGKVLPDVDPTDENAAPAYQEWIQPTGSTDAYALGDRVTHNGKVWESLVSANVWEPGVSQWREVTA